MQVSLVIKESPATVEQIWSEFHREKSNACGVTMKASQFELIEQRVRDSQMFIFPVKKKSGYFMLISQQQENTIAMTFLEDFKKQRLLASPYFMITYYKELQELKGLVLIRGESLSSSIAKEDSVALLNNFIRFYTHEEHYEEFVSKFNKDQSKFDYQKYMTNFDL